MGIVSRAFTQKVVDGEAGKAREDGVMHESRDERELGPDRLGAGFQFLRLGVASGFT